MLVLKTMLYKRKFFNLSKISLHIKGYVQLKILLVLTTKAGVIKQCKWAIFPKNMESDQGNIQHHR